MKKTLLQLVAALLSAALLASLWPPFNQSGNAWMALVPLLLLTRIVSVKRAFWLGALTGFLSWCVQLSWMWRLSGDNEGPWWLVLPALIGLSFVLSLFIGTFAALCACCRRAVAASPEIGIRKALWRLLLVAIAEPLLWAGCEVLRSNIFTGFSWNPLGLACVTNLPLLQTAALGGVAVTSALLVAVNGAIATLCERLWGAVTHTGPTTTRDKMMRSMECALPLLFLLLAFLWGLSRMQAYDRLPKQTVSVIVEATDVPCIFRGEVPAPLWITGAEKAEVLSLFPVAPALWIWPESATMGYPFPAARGATFQLQRLAQRAGVPLLVGGHYGTETVGPYNAAMLITPEGLDNTQVYAKRHLVPFGEYIPFDKTFPALQAFVPTGISCVPGEEVTTIRLPSGVVVGPLICFEDTVTSVARQSVLDGAQVLVNMSNDAWYAPSFQALQHAQQAILRAVELGVPMVRSTNRGTNTLVDAVGRMRILDESYPTHVPVTEAPFGSWYLCFGELVFGVPVTLLVLGLLCFFLLRRWHPQRTLPLLLMVGFAGALSAQSAPDALLPVADMALQDGQLNLAERAARQILSTLGLSPEEKARAEEVLIRAALAQERWDEALARIEGCPELPAERRTTLTLAVLNGRKAYDEALSVYAAAKLPTDTTWEVAALRLAIEADLATGKNLEASARFAQVQQAKGADAKVKAENALRWNATFPNLNSRAALLEAAKMADLGDPFLACALALPEAFAKAETAIAAETLLKELLEKTFDDPTVKPRLALAIVRLATDPKVKITYAQRAVELAKEESLRREALIHLGEAQCADPASVTQGLAHLAEAVRLNPSAPDAPGLQLRIAETLLAQKRPEEALNAYVSYLESYDIPELRTRVLQGKGRALLAAGRSEEALSAFSQAAEVSTSQSEQLQLLREAAQAAMTAQRYASAVTLYQKLQTASPTPAQALRLARALEANNQREEALKAYGDVCDDPAATAEDAFVAIMRKSALLAEDRRYTEVVSEITRFLGKVKEENTRTALQVERGRAYYHLRQLTKAQSDFLAASNSTAPDTASEARFFLVLCLYGLGEDEQARTQAKAYVTAYPESTRLPDVILWLAKSDFNRGDYPAAREGFADFAKRWPQDARVPQALLYAARAAYQSQDYLQTVELIASLAKAHPQSDLLPDARFLQAEALMELARYSEAAELLDSLIRRTSTAPWLGDAYGRKGDCLFTTATDDTFRLTLALEAYREALVRVDDNPDATLTYHYKIGRVFEKQDRRNDAAEQYAKLLYLMLTQPERYSEVGLDAAQKALIRLRAIEYARGNRERFQTLLQRLRRAHIQGLSLPEN